MRPATATMTMPMGFAVRAAFSSHWAAVTAPVATAEASITARPAIQARALRPAERVLAATALVMRQIRPVRRASTAAPVCVAPVTDHSAAR